MFLLLGVIIGGALGFFISKEIYQPSGKTVVSATVLREKLEKVMELTAVKSTYSERFQERYDDGYWGDVWDKQVDIDASGTAHFGYDLRDCRIDLNESAKTATISLSSDAKLLSLEHDIEITGTSDGWLTYLTYRDYNSSWSKAKNELLRQAYSDGPAFQACWEQRQGVLEMMELMCTGAGWKVVVVDNAAPPDPDLQ